MIDFRRLIQAGVHFGHQCSRWNPKMAPYIWGYSNDVHLINVAISAQLLENAAQFLESVAAEGKTILWIGTKKPAQEIVQRIATGLKYPYVRRRWIGGTLTNYPQVKKSITKLLYYEDILAKSEHAHYTKKELLLFQKMVTRLNENVGGIRTFNWPIGAIVIVDVRKEQAALKEAASVGIPVIALVDTNCDPSLVDYVIPGNDDAPKAINIIMEYLAQAVQNGLEKASIKRDEQAALDQSENPVEQVLSLEEEEDAEGKRSKAKKAKEESRARMDAQRRPEMRRKAK